MLIYVPLHYGYVLTMCGVDSVRSSEGSTRVHEDYIQNCTGMCQLHRLKPYNYGSEYTVNIQYYGFWQAVSIFLKFFHSR
jgi:hypothetical protein